MKKPQLGSLSGSPIDTRFGFGSRPASSIQKADHSGATGKITSILPDGSVTVTISTKSPLNNGQTVEICKNINGGMSPIGVGMLYIIGPHQYKLVPNADGFSNPEIGDVIRICDDSDSVDQNQSVSDRMTNLLRSRG